MPTDYAIKNGRTVMDAVLWVGNGTLPRTITTPTGFQPDFVWMKDRTVAYYHQTYDSVRGTGTGGGVLYPNSTDGVDDAYKLASFNSNGVTLGTNLSAVNANGSNIVGWMWQAGQGTTSTNTNGSVTSTVSVNATAGFSIATCTTPATNTNFTVGHGLGVAPAFIMVKNKSSTNNWTFYHQSTGAGGYLLSPNTAAFTANTDTWANTAPTSTVWSSNTPNWWSTSQNLVAYCWAEVAGFSKFGSYTGNGSANGPFIYTGFRPRWLMIRRTDSSGYSWFLIDTARNPYNIANLDLYANDPAAEAASNNIDILSNGFRPTDSNTGTNGNGGNFIYAAFAENPFKYANAR